MSAGVYDLIGSDITEEALSHIRIKLLEQYARLIRIIMIRKNYLMLT